jgi:predicted Zn-dependent peptidase
MQMADLVEGCGAGLRCDTNEDGLLISMKCRDLDSSQLLPLLNSMVHEPHLQADQVNLERELSLQALQRQREDPFHVAFDGWRHLAYGEGPYGHDPLGVAEELEPLNAESLRPIATSLSAEGAILALSGSIPAGLLDQLQADGICPQSKSMESDLAAQDSLDQAPLRAKQTVHLHPQSTEQVVLMLGQPTLPHGHPDDLALRLLQTHLGTGMSSLLFRRLREDHGVAYDVGVHHPARAKASPFVLHASTAVDKALTSLDLLMMSWKELMEHTLVSADLNLARAKFRGQLAHASQTTGQRAERRAQLRGLGLPDNHDHRCMEAMETLDGTALRLAASRHLSDPLLSLCGPQAVIESLADRWQQGLGKR